MPKHIYFAHGEYKLGNKTELGCSISTNCEGAKQLFKEQHPGIVLIEVRRYSLDKEEE